MSTKVISINNQKGGVGKTTTAISVGAVLAQKGYKVLLIDCDGSSISLTKILSKQNEIPEGEIKTTITDLVMMSTMGRDISALADSVVIKCKEGYSFIPADQTLVSSAVVLATQNNLDTRFNTMKSIVSHFRGKYDYIIMDAAPVLDILSINQLMAADELIIVNQCQQASRAAIDELLKSVNQFIKTNNAGIKIRGILVTMLDKRTKNGIAQIEQLKKDFPDIRIFDTVIPRAVDAERYVDTGMSPIFSNKKSKLTEAYTEFVEEYLKG